MPNKFYSTENKYKAKEEDILYTQFKWKLSAYSKNSTRRALFTAHED